MKNVKILGFPLWLYAVLTLIMVILGAMDWLPGNMLGSLAFALIVGTLSAASREFIRIMEAEADSQKTE